MPWVGNRYVPPSGQTWEPTAYGFREIVTPRSSGAFPRTSLDMTTTQQNNQAANLLTDLYNQLLKSSVEPVTQNTNMTTTQVNRQSRSPELEANIQGYIDRINSLSQGLTGAYGGVQGTFADMIAAVSDAYRTKASDASAAQREGALASGLTPLEAGGLSNQANLDVLNQMFPQVAQLKAEQAQQGVNLQNALVELQRGNYLPFIESVVAPYLQNVAGQTTTQTQRGETETIDPYQRLNLLANMATSIGSQDIQRTQLRQSGDEFAQQLELQRNQLASQENIAFSQLRSQERRAAESIAAARQEQLTNIEAQRQNALLTAALQQEQTAQQWQQLLARLGFQNQQDITNTFGVDFGDLSDFDTNLSWNNN